MTRRKVFVAALVAVLTMSNQLDVVGTALTYAGRSTLDFLKSRLVLASRVTRAYSGMVNSYGPSVDIPDLTLAGGATVRLIGGAAVATDILASTRKLTFSHLYLGVREDNIEEMITSFDALDRLAQQIAYGLGLKMDSIVAGLWNEIPYECGTLDGTSIWNPAATSDYLAPLADARKILLDNQTPDGELIFVQGTSEAREFRKLPSLLAAYSAGSPSLLRTGTTSPIMGFDMLESQQIQNATLSAAAATSSPGAVNGNHARNAITLAANGLGAGTVKAGTTFKIAGVVNATGHDVRFSVLTDTTIVANAATLPIYPALPVAVVDTTAITFTEHTAQGSMNMAFHPAAVLAMCTTPPAWRSGSGISSVVVDDPETGFAVRMSIKSTLLGDAGAAFSTELVGDCYYAAKCIRPEFAVKVTGKV